MMYLPFMRLEISPKSIYNEGALIVVLFHFITSLIMLVGVPLEELLAVDPGEKHGPARSVAIYNPSLSFFMHAILFPRIKAGFKFSFYLTCSTA